MLPDHHAHEHHGHHDHHDHHGEKCTEDHSHDHHHHAEKEKEHHHGHGHDHAAKEKDEEIPAWKKQALEAGDDPMAAPFGGTWNAESSLSAKDHKMEE